MYTEKEKENKDRERELLVLRFSSLQSFSPCSFLRFLCVSVVNP